MADVVSVWDDDVSGVKKLLRTSTREKLAFCAFVSLTFAFISDFVAKFIAGIIYFSWAVFLLPTPKSKLSVQLLWDVGIIFLTLFVADITYFGLFFHFQNKWITNTAQKLVDYQSLIFFMNVVRISVILFCLVTSCSTFMKSNFKSLPFQTPKKDGPTPHKMKLRSFSKTE